MLTRAQIKERAKGLVKNNLGTLIGFTLLYGLISGVMGSLSGLINNAFLSFIWSIVVGFAGIALSLGFYSTLMRFYKSEGRDMNIGRLFDYFKQLSLVGKVFLVFFVLMVVMVIVFTIIALVTYST